MAPEPLVPHFVETELPEPHCSRRKRVLQLYPRVRRLLSGSSPLLRWQLLAAVGLQLSGAFYGRSLSWPPLLLMAYTVGGVGAHALWTLIHECSHDQVFGRRWPVMNQMAAMLANLPLVIPHAVAFRRYHLLHHKHLGQPGLDPDMPTALEARIVGTSPLRKLLYLLLQPLVYYSRPLLVQPLSPSPLELINIAVQLAFNLAVVQVWGWSALGYLLASFLLSMGLHPLAAHFLTDHVRFDLRTRSGLEPDSSEPPQETFSYYGPLNQLVNNEGYHSEHHDFPSVASDRLPELSRLADGVYGRLHCHFSWPRALYAFITDRRISLQSRIRRNTSNMQK